MKTAGAAAGGLAVGSSSFAGSASASPIPTPQLSVDGNTFVDPEGNKVTLRGVNIIDPRRADVLAPTRGKNAVQMVDNVTGGDWGTQVIRVPLQPSDILETETGYAGGPATPGAFSESDLETYLADHVDDVVDRCEEQGVYCILDYHRHWTNGSSEGSNPEFDGSWGSSGSYNQDLQDEVVMFWDVVANRYGDRSHTLYEVYNEPTKPGLWGDPTQTGWVADNWLLFVDFIQPCLDQIEEHTDNPILLGNPSWTQSPEGILLTEENYPGNQEFRQIDEPENLAMTYHIYAGHPVSQDNAWDTVAGNGEGLVTSAGAVYEEYPLVVTEFGWDNTLGQPSTDNPLPGTTTGFGEPFLEFMESGTAKDAVSWTAWCADIWWDPTMFDRGFEGSDTSISNPYEGDIPQDCESLPCEWELLGGEDFMGEFIKSKLSEFSDHNNPAGEVPTGPSAPSNVSASAGSTSIDVSWDAVDAADEYNVYLDGSMEDSTSSTSLTISGLDSGTEYTVGVAATNADGESSTTTTTATTTDGPGPCEDIDSETLSDGSTVCDVDGDGEYRDVTGDGSVTNSDVTEFFGNQHVDPWDSRSDLFDFTGDGEVSQADVIELFSSVN